MTKQFGLLALLFIACSCTKKEREEVKYHDNGMVKSIRIYNQDSLLETEEIYWETGKLSQKYNYENGKKNGEYLLFYKNGFIAEKGNMTNDLRHGLVYKYFGKDSAKIKREEYILLAENDKEFYYYVKEFDHQGRLTNSDLFLEFNPKRTDSLKIKYVGDQVYDSMKLVMGDYDYRFNMKVKTKPDTFTFHANNINISKKHILLNSEFLRGRFYGFSNILKGDTIFTTMEIKFFEEKLK